ncbi:hypothetical protein M0P98_08270 [bacterium]|nr:hypothetical protein [bacterium]
MKKNVEIRDIMTAAFLLAKKHTLVSHNVGPSGFVTFIFNDSKGSIEREIQKHISGTAKVGSRDFVEAYRGLRSLILHKKEEIRNGKFNSRQH